LRLRLSLSRLPKVDLRLRLRNVLLRLQLRMHPLRLRLRMVFRRLLLCNGLLRLYLRAPLQLQLRRRRRLLRRPRSALAHRDSYDELTTANDVKHDDVETKNHNEKFTYKSHFEMATHPPPNDKTCKRHLTKTHPSAA